MKNQPRPSLFPVGLLFVSAFVLLFLPLQLPETATALTPIPQGGPSGPARITGRITAGGAPLAGAKVVIDAAGGAHPMTAITLSDSAGNYEAFVPRGRAVVRVSVPGFETDLWHTAKGMTPVRSGAAETSAGVPVDFAFGALDLRVHAPAELNGAVSYAVAALGGNAAWRARRDTDQRYGMRRVLFPALPPGGYLVQVFVGEARVYLNNSLDAESADTIRIEPGNTRVIDTTFVLRHLTGMVRGSWETIGAHNPHIALYAGAQNEVSYADADDAGNWSADFLAPGPVRIRLDVGSIRRWLGGRGYETATVFHVPAQGDSSLGTLLESGVEVHLEGADAWKPFHALAELYNPSGEMLYQQAGTGSLRFPNLEAGSYVVRVLPTEPSPWSPQWVDRSPSRSGAVPVRVAADGAITPVRCVLEAGGVLRGTVVRAGGGPPGRVVLRVRTTELGTLDAGATAPDGSFRIEGVPAGEIRLGAIVRGRGPERTFWYPGTEAADSARAIVMKKGAEVSGVEVRVGY